MMYIQGLDTIKTKGESVAMVLALVGAGINKCSRSCTINGVLWSIYVSSEPLKEATGRIVGFQLIPLSALGRPRIGEYHT